jgi:hypothetical protein
LSRRLSPLSLTNRKESLGTSPLSKRGSISPRRPPR